jgi:hypothetical protein
VKGVVVEGGGGKPGPPVRMLFGGWDGPPGGPMEGLKCSKSYDYYWNITKLLRQSPTRPIALDLVRFNPLRLALISFPFTFAFSLSLLGLTFSLSIALPFSFENASITVPFTFTIPVAVAVTVAIESRIARRPSHERVWIWEGRSSGGCREAGGAGPDVHTKIGRYTGWGRAGGHEFCPETRYFLFILLAYFAVLGLEVIEALTNDIKFIDLTGDWIDGLFERKFEIGWNDWEEQTFSVKLIPLVTKVNDVLCEAIELGSDDIKTFGETIVGWLLGGTLRGRDGWLEAPVLLKGREGY